MSEQKVKHLKECPCCHRPIDKITVRYYCPICGEQIPPADKLSDVYIIPPNWTLQLHLQNCLLAAENVTPEMVDFVEKVLRKEKGGEKL